MKTKHIETNLDKIIEGLNIAADLVKSTMGGQGKTVIISSNDEREKLRFTKDGVSVAKAINLDDPIKNVGAKILISAANKTVEECGDGTTLTSLLLQILVAEAKKYINKSKDVNGVLNAIEDSIIKVIELIKQNTIPVRTIDEIGNIAKISSNSERIGQLFKEIYQQTGLDALITLEKSENSDITYYDVTKGIQFDNGFVHSSFMTNKDTEQAIYENAYIHIDNQPVSSLTEKYEELLSASHKHKIPLIIIAPRFSDAFIRVCSMNKVNQGTPVCLIKTPGFAHGQKKNIDDITAFLSDDGTVDKIMIDAYKFILYNNDTPKLEERLNQLKSLSETAQDKYDEKDYLDRLYKLKGSTAIIYAGGKTPEAMKEEYDRLEDAIGATKTAVISGYVEGGGLLFTKIALSEKLHNAVKNTLLCPMSQILENANVKSANIDLDNPLGYNVNTKSYENFLETGVIDPANVLITALQNAFINTKLLINTSSVIYNEYNKNII